MKMILCVIKNRDKKNLTTNLLHAGLQVLPFSSSGGIFKTGYVTLLCTVRNEHVDLALDTIRETCKRRHSVHIPIPEMKTKEVPDAANGMTMVGGARVYVVDLERFERV